MALPPRVIGMSVACVDELLIVPHMPESDGTINVSRCDRQGGGIAATAMVAAARLGCRASLIGAVGADPIGEEVLAGLRVEKVDVSRVRIDPEGRTNFSVILVEERTGKRSIVYWPGCVEPFSLDRDDVDLIRSARGLLVDGHGVDAQVEAARAARDAGVPVLMDGTRAYPGIDRLIPWIDILVATRDFVSDYAPDDDLEAGLRKLRAMGPGEVVATAGEEGCWLLEDGCLWHQPAFPVDVVDTTGAGDVFHGAYIATRAQGKGPRDACRCAAGAAAMKCTGLGGRRAIPTRAELEAFLARA
ncbi:MAG: hypothetical protein JXP34_13675 [Planctomycetes bacterium]|nr:hypothetical protein [Planctomycetota bacterium]